MSRHGCLALVACVLALAFGAGAQEMRTLERQRSERILTPALRERLSEASRVRAWVFFTDKAVWTEAALERAVTAAEQRLSPRARARRALRGSSLGFRDVPVHGPYVESVAAAGARVRQRSRWLNAVSVEATLGELLEIARLPFVASIDALRGRPETSPPPRPEHDPSLRGAREAAGEVQFYGFDPVQYEKAQIVEAHDVGYTGADVLICMFDAGFDPAHPALRELPLVAERDFVQGDGVTSDEPDNVPPDQTVFGNAEMCHGTSTWSVAGGYLSGRHVGVAFGASFAIAKTEYGGYERHVEEDNWTAAAEWADSLGADIISSSLGYRYDFDDGTDYGWDDLDGKTTIVAIAANVATEAGILVVNAVGNDQGRGDGTRTLNSPSDSDSVLAVGAVHPTSEVVATFSSFGPGAPVCPTCPERIKPDVLAQGIRVHAATASECYDLEPFYSADEGPLFDQEDIQGTSFSCPITAGAAALVLEAHPAWKPHELRYALQRTASDFSRGIQPSVQRGYGVIRVMDAMDIPGFGNRLAPRRPSPFALVDPRPFGETGAAIDDPTPAFLWREAGPGRFNLPITYDLELSPSLHFDEDVVRVEGVEDTTMTLESPLPAEGFYYWRVLASDASGFPRESRQRGQILHDSPPQPFDLVWPAPDDTVTSSLWPTLRWRRSFDASPADTITYDIELANDPGFTNSRFFRDLPDTLFTPPANAPLGELRHHYWRVMAVDRFGATATSTPRSFLVGAFPPSAFMLEHPSNGDTIPTLRPTLRWEAATDPNPDDTVRYTVFVGTAPDAVDTIIGTIGATEIRLQGGLLADDQEVFWRVVANDSFGNGTPSALRSFHTYLAPQPFALVAPTDGQSVFGSSVTLSWEATVDETPGDVITYRATIYDDQTLTSVVATSDPVTATSVAVAIPDELMGTLYWRVRATDVTERETWSSETRRLERLPAPPAFAARAFPNPFDPRRSAFTVSYDVPAALGGEILRVTIHDVLGRVVRTVIEEPASIGSDRTAGWDGRTAHGVRAPAGVYFVRVSIAAESTASRVVVVGR